MKVLHLISGIGRELGGPSRSVQGLVAALERTGVETWLMSMTPGDRPWMDGVRHFRAASRHGYFAAAQEASLALREIRPDLVHLHGIWNLDLHAAARAARKLGVPYVIAPRGSLDAWSLRQKRLKKRLARFVYQDRDLHSAAALHATAAVEVEQFRALGFKNPIFLSPNAVNVPPSLPPFSQRADGRRRLLFLSRIHIKKGLLNLIEAWGRLRPEGWCVEVVGFNEKGHWDDCLRRIRELGIEKDFLYTGPLADNDKWAAYRRADAFVLPTYTENFGIVIAEALYAGIPVLTTKGAPWEDLVTHDAGWWIEIGVEPLIDGLRAIFAADDATRRQMGERGHRLILERYSWAPIAERLRVDYTSLLKK